MKFYGGASLTRFDTTDIAVSVPLRGRGHEIKNILESAQTIYVSVPLRGRGHEIPSVESLTR